MGHLRGSSLSLGTALLLGASLVPPTLTTSSPVEAQPIAAVAVSRCHSTDNGNPVLTGVVLSPATVDVRNAAASVQVSVTALDTGGPGPASEVAAVQMNLVQPDAPSFLPALAALVRGQDGIWRTTVRIPMGVRSGAWQPLVFVADRAGNVNVDGTGAGVTPEPLTVISTVDSTAPELTDFALSRIQVDSRHTAQHVGVRARIRDDHAGVRRVSVSAVRIFAGRHRDSILLRRVSGSARDGEWSGSLTIPRWSGNGTWRLNVALADEVENLRTYSPRDLGALGWDRRIAVTSDGDAKPPTVSGARIRPTSVDARRADRRVVITVRVRDRASGVASVRQVLFHRDGSGLAEVVLHKVAGTRRDGTWRGTLIVRRCAARAGVWLSTFGVQDRSRRSAGIRGPHLHVLGPDVTTPVVERVNFDSVVLRFNEAVTGITTTSAPVTQSGNPVPGKWKCIGAAGAQVDCATGHVRQATFVPVSAQPDALYTGILNPEHSLGVTDLAGNPIGPQQTF